MLKALVLLLISGPLFAAPPTISAIQPPVMDTNTALIVYTTSDPTSQCWVQFGIASGIGHPENYLWSSISSLAGYNPGLCSIPINGLKDGTTYYFLPTARPNLDDETDICNSSGCGATEVSGTTPAASVSHLPASPTAVQANLMCEPDDPACSTYTIPYVTVHLAATGAGGECVVTDTVVNAPTGYSGSVVAGDTLTTIFANPETKFWFGTVFEVPQGTFCLVPGDGTGHGYYMSPLAVDPLASGIADPHHRFVILRTHANSPSDFPPFGSRTGPTYFAKYGGFQQNQNTPNLSLNNGGIIFNNQSGGGGQIHHVWIENLKMCTGSTVFDGVCAAGGSNGDHDYFMMWGRGAGGQPAPFPKYIVLRGNYFHLPARAALADGVPYSVGVSIATMGPNMQQAIVGNYADNLWFGSGGYPNVFYFQDCGFAATVCTGGPVLIENNYVTGMGEPVYVEINNHGNPNPTDFTVRHNGFYLPRSAFAYADAQGSSGCSRSQFEFKGMLRAIIAGNYVKGQWACANTGNVVLTFNAVDLTIRSNYLSNIASGFGLNGSNAGGNGVTSYSSTANRILISNNILDKVGRSVWPPGSGIFQAAGGGGGEPLLEMESSPSNIWMIGNTVAPMGNDFPGTNGLYAPVLYLNGGSGAVAGLRIQRNLLPFGTSIFGAHYAGITVQNALATAGTFSHPATPLPTQSISPVLFSDWLGTSAGYLDGASGLGMTGVSVIAGGAGYTDGAPLLFTNCSSTPAGTLSSSTGVIYGGHITAFGICAPTTMTVNAGAGGASLRPHYGLTPEYSGWNSNWVYCTSDAGADATVCPASISSMPNKDVYTTGGSTSARLTAAGFPNGITNSDWRCTPTAQSSCAIGANVNQVESELGIVSHVSARISGVSAAISYVAPDNQACSVDLSSNAGAAWTRLSDSGGSRQRSVSFPGLTVTHAYLYRIACYFDQSEATTAGWFSFPSDPSNLQTSGSFTTLSNTTRTVAFPFSLGSFATAALYRVTMTSPDGSTQYITTCASSPCNVMTVPVGDYLTYRQWLNGSSVVIASTDQQVVTVR